MRLPLVAPLGSRIPLRSQIPGRTFRQDPQPETTSHFSTECWDVVSTEPFTGKPHPIPKANSGTQLPQPHPSGNPPPTPHTSGHRTISLLGLPSIKGRPRVTKKAPRISRLSHLYCFARRTANGEATLPAQPSWRLRPCCQDLPWWDGPSRQPSCRAAS